MSEDVFEKPLVMKDFVKGKKKARIRNSAKRKLYEKVNKLPASKKQKKQSKYMELVNAIAKEKKGTYKVLLNDIKEDLTPKSAYSSVERALIQVAKRDGVDFGVAIERHVMTNEGLKTYVSHPAYIQWKEDNLRLRVVNGELFLEKRTDRPL